MTKLILIVAIFISSFLTVLQAQTKAEKYFYQGEYTTCIELLENKLLKDNISVAEFKLLASSYEKQYDYKKAIYTYEKGLENNTEHELLIEGLADAQLSLGYKKESLEGYLHLLEIDSTNLNVKGKVAGVLMDLNRYAKAKLIYLDLYTADSTNVFFMRRLMQSEYKLQNYYKLTQMKEENPYFPSENKEMNMMVADSYFKLNQNPEALFLLESILNNDSLYIPAISKTGYIYFASYRAYESAVVYYRKLNELEQFSDPFHLKNLAICEYFTGNQHFSATILDSLSRVIENDPFIPFYAGLSYKKIGNVDKALEMLEKASSMVIPAYTGDVYHHLGRAYAAKRMFRKALSTYQKVREYDPKNYQVLYDIAVTYEEYNLNRTMAMGFYQQFVKECSNERSSDLKYAESRIKMIKEELFFEGD
jgi:tetratricopeptide (TPR) repeat protein